MSLRILPVVLLVTIAFAGCLNQGTDLGTDGLAEAVDDLLAGAPLWADPQNTPHPAYNWPTMSSPAPNGPAWWQPIDAVALPATITGLQLLAKPEGVTKGSGIAVFGKLAVVPDDAAEAFVVDISDPSNPTVLSSFPSAGRGAAIIAYPTGRLVTVLAAAGNIEVVDITNPEDPIPLDPIVPTQGSHKLGVVPGTPFVYNAASVGGEGADGVNPLYGPGPSSLGPEYGVGLTEIYDLSDPEAPVLVQDWANGYSCHHIFFWNSLEKQRGICAGMQYTQIWDTADPAHPEVIVSVPVHHGVANTPSGMASIAAFSHSAGMNIDGDILYVGDEMNGGGLPPGCVAGVDTPAGRAGTPIGATWFYDISDETNPQLLGYYSAMNDPRIKPDPTVSCTTHHGRIVPAEGRDLLAMSYYGAGVILVDFTGIGPGTLPQSVAQFADGSNTWETWYYQGYLFTGDLARGMDVIQIV